MNNGLIVIFLIIIFNLFGTIASADPSGTLPMFKHPPYALNMCEKCHQTDSAGKTISDKFIGTQPDICSQCHESKMEGSVVHPALFMGDCTSMCHNPHESSFRPLLKDKVINLCVTCHTAPGLDQTFRHSAVDMVKSCVRCHNPHSSEQPKLMREETPKLCVYCHKDIGKGLEDKTNVLHPAIQMGCQACHQPHGSSNTKLTQKTTNELCMSCHVAPKFDSSHHPVKGHPLTLANDPIYPEKPFTCISCHKPHYSKNKALLRYRYKDKPYDGTICSVCHWKILLPPPAPPRPKWND